jgi:hypothetical protein
MRLTLRTLLAYLDDILEPSQAREIGDKLNESSFASSLVSRIREVMRRRRLTAPTLSGPGVGIDPNTVAEYLDNTLPPDGVADVEKICLESDVHLAEVAACHQILTLALGEPVDISNQTRERMYAVGPTAAKMALDTPEGHAHAPGSNGLSNRAVGEILSQAPSAFAGPTTAAAPASEPVKIPDYLRPRSNFKHLIGYTVVAVVVIGWGILMIKDSPFFNRKNQGPTSPGNLVADNGNKKQLIGEEVPPQQEVPVNSDGAGDRVTPDGSGGDVEPPQRTVAAATKARSVDLPPPDEFEDEPPVRKKKSKVLTGDRDEESVADKVEAANQAGAGGNTAQQPVPPPPPAKYVSNDGVTLNYVARDERWFMLPRRALVHGGDLLAVPEPFQCALEIDGGKSLATVIGGSVVRVLEPTEAAPFGLEIKRGQFVVRPPGATDESAQALRVGVVIAGDLWRLECQPGSVAGVQIRLNEPTSLEQILDKNAYLGGFYVSMGQAEVTDPAGKKYTVKGPGWLQLPVRPVPEGERAASNPPLLAIPKWMAPPTLTTTAQNYAKLFEKRFSLDDAVEMSVPKVADDGNPEISRLATECLALIEDYSSLVDILHRSPHEEARRAAISGLRLWLPRNPDNKDLLKAELSKRFPPEDAETVYKLLWGFDENDVRTKVISMQLIDWMGDPELSIRELAFYHVYRFTGKTHDYRPNGTILQMKSSLPRWRQHVNREGGLLPAQKPAPGQ